MSDQYVGEIRMFAGNFAPQDWHFCDGSLLSISENELLFALIGTTYGGDGSNTFGLPDLRGRIPVHTSASNPSHPLGQKAGTETVTLVQNHLPAHTHVAKANNVAAEATSSSPEGQFWGVSAAITSYSSASPNVTMSTKAVLPVGANLPHSNMMPSLAISFIIALNGNYPSQI